MSQFCTPRPPDNAALSPGWPISPDIRYRVEWSAGDVVGYSHDEEWRQVEVRDDATVDVECDCGWSRVKLVIEEQALIDEFLAHLTELHSSVFRATPQPE